MQCFVLGSGGMMPMPTRRLTSVALRLEGSLEMRIGPEAPLEEAGKILRRHSGPSVVRFRYRDASGKEVVMRCGSEWSVSLQAALLDELQALLGEDKVKVVAPLKTAQLAPQPRWKRNNGAGKA